MKPSSKIQFLKRLALPTEFPATFLPVSVEAFRRMLTKSADTCDDFAIAHIAATVGVAIGRHVSALVQNGWNVKSNLFVALVAFKGAGKSSLAEATFAPLYRHEEQLAEEAAETSHWNDDDDSYDDDEREEEIDVKERQRPVPPPVIATDVTGPAVIQLLKSDPRQLLVHTDELATLLIKNTGGVDRQLFCNFADSLRRRQCRATERGPSKAIVAPHVGLLGCLTPDLLKTAYSSRGDDGFWDRFIIAGTGDSTRPSWPEDVHDSDLAEAWGRVVDRLLRIETEALDALDGKLTLQFTPEAIDRFRGCVERLNQVADAVRMPEAQRGTVNKMKGFMAKFAMIRRCLRWAAGEFGAEGPVGPIDADDAESACEAAAFFFGRWLIWRPELTAGLLPSEELIGLIGDPGNDPALLGLASMANAAQVTVRTVERLVRYLRWRGGWASLADMLASGPMATVSPEALQEACSWLVEQRQAHWEAEGRAIALEPLPAKASRGRKRSGSQTVVAR